MGALNGSILIRYEFAFVSLRFREGLRSATLWSEQMSYPGLCLPSPAFEATHILNHRFRAGAPLVPRTSRRTGQSLWSFAHRSGWREFCIPRVRQTESYC